MGHILSAKMVSKVLRVGGGAHTRFLEPWREPADRTRPLTWSRCAWLIRKHLGGISHGAPAVDGEKRHDSLNERIDFMCGEFAEESVVSAK